MRTPGIKTLIAVKSCARDVGAHQAIRDTWGSYVYDRADVRFFVGREATVRGDDEICIPRAPDHYLGLSVKVDLILEYAVGSGYDNIVLVDTDTFIVPDRLFALPFGQYDYFGMILPFAGGFMFGGCGFAISRDAANIVLNAPIMDPMDDISIGRILLHRPQPDIRVAPHKWNRYIGWHFPKSTYPVKTYSPNFPWMRLMAQKHLKQPMLPVFWDTHISGHVRRVQLELTREDRESI